MYNGCYYLPLHLAFLNSTRWLNFWDILYYTAYQNEVLLPSSSPSTIVHLGSRHFSRMLFGLASNDSLTPTLRESGRKTLSQLLHLAHQQGLLRILDEDADVMGEELNTLGSKAQHHFELPLYHPITPTARPTLGLHKPSGYIEKGWLRALGHDQYAHHLLNLWLWQPALASATLGVQAPILREAYAAASRLLPVTFQPQPKGQSEPLARLERRLQQAWTNLETRGFWSKSAKWDAQILESAPPAGLVKVGQPRPLLPAAASSPLISPDSDAADADVKARLTAYAFKDRLRGERLQQMWGTGLLAPRELGSAWQALTGFWSQNAFEDLLRALSQRELVQKQGRHLSWQEVEAMARVAHSKRGQHISYTYAGSASPIVASEGPQGKGKRKKEGQVLRQVQYRVEKLAVPPPDQPLCAKFFRPALEPFMAAPHRLHRVRLEGWVHIANWRAIQSGGIPTPAPTQILVRLSDAQGHLIFADQPRSLDLSKPTTQWKVPLHEEFVNGWWHKQDWEIAPAAPFANVFMWEVGQQTTITTTPRPQSSTAKVEQGQDWFTLALRLTFFPTSG